MDILHLPETLRCVIMDTDTTNFFEFKITDWALNEDGARVLRTIEGLRRNFKKYGAAYCPCKIERIEENICPCKEHLTTGKCICGLYKGK